MLEALTDSPKQKLGNMNKETNYSLRCINCGCKAEINLIAHRNVNSYITGFIAVCGNCNRLLNRSKQTIQMVIEGGI